MKVTRSAIGSGPSGEGEQAVARHRFSLKKVWRPLPIPYIGRPLRAGIIFAKTRAIYANDRAAYRAD